ncbi:hypothetical protein [Atlantibacter hermannii]|uniref:hypothetical protein n=1 Tax=Atlantibacter hermannii TaxID=565 RepID=UPI00289EDDE6|nr:hypothetical protein [Atlantibacter hermannii]
MSKSTLFITAWSIARNAAAMFGGSVKSYFAESLKLAYAQQSQPVISTEQKLLDLGMRVWTGGNHRRIYVNAEHWAEVFGLVIDVYKTGNIKSAALNGETISNTKAYKLIALRPYFDCNTQKFVSNMTPII